MIDRTYSTRWRSYLNTAGSGLQSRETREAVADYLTLEGTIGSYFAERAYAELIQDGVYRSLAQLFNCPREAVAMSDSATRAWHSAVAGLTLTAGDTVWTTPYEWAGNLLFLKNAQRTAGFSIQEIPLTPDGDVDIEWCHQHISDRVALISVTHMPSCTGALTPLAPFSELVRDRRTLLVVDACQSVGQLPIDLTDTPVDLLTANGKKSLLGPRGTGFAVVSPRFLAAAEPVSVDVHTHAFAPGGGIRHLTGGATRLELGERSVSAFVGLDTALRQARSNDWDGMAGLSKDLRERARQIPGLRVHAPGTHHTGIICVTHERIGPEQLWHELCRAGVACWLIDGAHTPNYLLRNGISHAVRLAVGPRTTQQEIDYAIGVLEEIGSRRASVPAMAAPREKEWSA
ncbi:aminotransferase class V-fold PLP-dependent enzyme [Streptomyces sp. NBC_01283]|uniref:aminotransferase class V-fold PLP-dependent enzyme n=1 Tax=Streptomyces sp. NBC_01283 TaxID=2903812 RepID=UPI00352EB458|nr:aminotransferase class V-fold PLP-dependent enzyme [Streptomyces sp. NBC_01283]WSL21372.1 aminotransferase class V-fold PLP-dependent enzyme [Streptomyces sp. NBC_01283]